MRRLSSFFFAGLFALLLLAMSSLAATSLVSAGTAAQAAAEPPEIDPLVVVWLVFLFALSLVMAFRHYRNRWDLR